MSDLEALIKSHDPNSSPDTESMDEETFKPDNYSVRKVLFGMSVWNASLECLFGMFGIWNVCYLLFGEQCF